MSKHSDSEADRLLEGLTTRGIYHVAWTLVKARFGIGFVIAGIGILYAVTMGILIGVGGWIFRAFGG